MARRDKRLCFRCDEKFIKGHRCKQKELNVMLVNDNDDKEETTMETNVEAEPIAMQDVEVGDGIEL